MAITVSAVRMRMVRVVAPMRTVVRISSTSAIASSSSSSSLPGRQNRRAISDTVENSTPEMARCAPRESPSAIAPADMAPPSTAPIDHTAWKELMMERR